MITTERLALRRLTHDDFADIRRIHSDPDVMWVYGGVFSEDKTREFIQRNLDRYEKHGVAFFAITMRDGGEIIGCGGIIMQETDQGVEPESDTRSAATNRATDTPPRWHEPVCNTHSAR